MNLKSESGFSLIEIGIALLVAAVFMVSSITLLSGSNENYRRIEQRSIALSYAMKAIEITLLEDAGMNLDDIQKKALDTNNMEIGVDTETVTSSDGTKELQIVTANVTYHIKGEHAGEEQVLKLQTLKVDN